MPRFGWYKDGPASIRLLSWVIIVLALLLVLGYVLGAPADARAAIPKCTQAEPCTAREAATLKQLGQVGRIQEESVAFTTVRSAKSDCKTHAIRRTVRNTHGSAMMWGTMTKVWCYTKNGYIVFSPKAKVQTGVTGFGTAIGFHHIETAEPLEQRYPWRNDIRRGSWSWRSFKAKQEIPVIKLGIFHLRTTSFVLTIRAHGDGTSTDNGNDTP